MQHHDVYHVDEHDFDLATNYCVRCGLHERMVAEQQYKCRFSLNLSAISHLRAQRIQEEKLAAEREKFRKLCAEIMKDVGIEDE